MCHSVCQGVNVPKIQQKSKQSLSAVIINSKTLILNCHCHSYNLFLPYLEGFSSVLGGEYHIYECVWVVGIPSECVVEEWLGLFVFLLLKETAGLSHQQKRRLSVLVDHLLVDIKSILQLITTLKIHKCFKIKHKRWRNTRALQFHHGRDSFLLKIKFKCFKIDVCFWNEQSLFNGKVLILM